MTATNGVGKFRAALDLIATIAMIVAAVGVAWTAYGVRANPGKTRGVPSIPKEPVSLDGAATKGNSSAKVVILEYSDFECPFCRDFTLNTLPTLEKRYLETGQVQFAFRHLPLAIHKSAERAAQAAECARQQGLFWEMHDSFFRDQAHLNDDLVDRARRVGVAAPVFETCLQDPRTSQTIRADRDAAAKLALVGTPVFLIGKIQAGGVKVDRIIQGAEQYDVFSSAIDRLLSQLPPTVALAK